MGVHDGMLSLAVEGRVGGCPASHFIDVREIPLRTCACFSID